MAKCGKCGIEVVLAEDLYEDRGLQICEDCKIKSTASPSQYNDPRGLDTELKK